MTKHTVQRHLSSTALRVNQDLEKLLGSPEYAGTSSADPIGVASTATGGRR